MPEDSCDIMCPCVYINGADHNGFLCAADWRDTMPKIDTADFKNGVSIIVDNDIYTIVWFQHHKPGKGGAVMRTKLKNLKTGAVIDRTFNAGEKFEQAILERHTMQYLYQQDDEYVLMDPQTFD